MKLHICSYNIRICIEQGVDAVAAVLTELGADIVALQEVGRFWRMGPPGDLTEQLAEACAYPHHIFVPALFDGDGAYGIALLSRLPIVQTEKVELPCRDDEQRVLCKAELMTSDGDSLHVWTSHLSIASWDRSQQLQWIGRAMERAQPDVFLGDINTEPSDPVVLKWPMANAWPDKPQKTYPTRAPKQSLDSIFFGARCRVVKKTQAHEVTASDHLPITATARHQKCSQ
jgi:endonuclease/exonuclease/phosphatase family metal-dependent hydrolase